MSETGAWSTEPTLLRRAIGVAGTRLALLVIGALASVLIARALGPAGRGQYAYVIAVASSVAAIAHASVEQAQVYLYSLGLERRQLAANAVLLGVCLGVAAGGLVAATGVVSGFPNMSRPMWLAIGVVPPTLVVLYLNGLLVLEGRTNLLNRGTLLAGSCQVLLLGAVAASGRMTVGWVVSIWGFSSLLPLLVNVPALSPRRRNVSTATARMELRIGLRYHGGMAATYLLWRVDVLILAEFTDDRTVGLYAIAVTIAELTYIATDSLATAVIARQTREKISEAAALTAQIVGLSIVFAGAAAVALALVSPFVIPFLYGGEFKGASGPLVALLPGVMALAASRSAAGYLIRLDRPWLITGLASAALLLNVALNFALIPRFGAVGAGVASSIAYCLLAFAQANWLFRSSGLGLGHLDPRRGWSQLR